LALTCICRVTAVRLYIYMLLGITTWSWKILLVSWKVLEFVLGKTVFQRLILSALVITENKGIQKRAD